MLMMNTKAISAAQKKIEALMASFETKEFKAEQNGITVVLLGDMSLHSVSGDVTSQNIMAAYQIAKSALEHERAVNFARVRNEILSQYKFDVKNVVPEIAKAIAYLNNKREQAA